MTLEEMTMETAAAGRVITTENIENLKDRRAMRSRRLIGNPANAGEHVYELY